jgi:hypothetical protein
MMMPLNMKRVAFTTTILYTSAANISQNQSVFFLLPVEKLTTTVYAFTMSLCPWSYGIWNYNDLCNQCLSPPMLWVRISIRVRCTILCDKVCQWLATGRWFSPGPPVSSTNKTDRHDITEIVLKVALNTIKNKQITKIDRKVKQDTLCVY